MQTIHIIFHWKVLIQRFFSQKFKNYSESIRIFVFTISHNHKPIFWYHVEWNNFFFFLFFFDRLISVDFSFFCVKLFWLTTKYFNEKTKCKMFLVWSFQFQMIYYDQSSCHFHPITIHRFFFILLVFRFLLRNDSSSCIK